MGSGLFGFNTFKEANEQHDRDMAEMNTHSCIKEFCSQCGRKINIGDLFCSCCGNML